VITLRFLTNGMLGKLTRWLRMLGHDVEYTGSLNDKALIEKAKKESRILLTRDLELYQQAIGRGAEAFLIESPNQTANLVKLARRFRFQLEIDVKISRCPKCNTQIKPVSKASIIDKIPKTTASNYEQFWKCLGCGQVYWRGAHWKRIDRTLTEAKRTLEA